jgi:hypothetical protein
MDITACTLPKAMKLYYVKYIEWYEITLNWIKWSYSKYG